MTSALRPAEPDRLPAISAALRAVAARHGTPTYVTDVGALDAAADELRAAFPDPWLRAYSLKANDLPAVVARLAGAGLGANVVSRGEWSLATRSGVSNAAITLEGIGKTDADLRAAVRTAADGRPLRWVALESIDEARALAALARRAGFGRADIGRAGFGRADPGRAATTRLDVLLRLNPDVVPETQAGLAVGAGNSKFGLSEAEFGAAIEAGGGPDGPLRWRGIHLHVGSQLGAVDAWRDAVRRGLGLLALWRGSLPDFDTLDIGGGFPVGAIGDAVPRPERFAREIPALLEAIPADRRPARLAVEPGRFLVARAGLLLARVLHVRERGGGPIVVIDAGMTELIRPALYGAHHGIVALTSLGRPVEPMASGAPGANAEPDAGAALSAATRGIAIARVDGPICESTDSFGEHRLPVLRRGDLVVIRDAGAYGSVLSSRYNGRPRPAEVQLEPDGRMLLVRRRGSLASLR